MAKRTRAAVIACAAVLAVGLGGWWAYSRQDVPGLDRPAEMTLHSIAGRDHPSDQPTPAGETFHGYPVLGKVEVTDPAAREEIAAALRAGMADRPAAAACFWPRHGVRVTSFGGTVTT